MALAAVCFLGALFGVERRDDGWLLMAAGRPVDVAGSLASLWNRGLRECSPLTALAPGDPVHERALEALRGYSPPDSHSARVGHMLALGPWRLLQATFDTLEPVVVVVRDDGAAVEVLSQAVWSGSTRPWDAGWRIRDFLGARAEEVPRRLIDCLEPLTVFSARPAEGRPAAPHP